MKQKNVLKTLKQVAVIVVTAGVGAIVGNAVKHVTPSDTGFVKKTCIGAGSLVLAGMLSDKAGDYTKTKIDETVEEVKEMFQEAEDEEVELIEEEIAQEA